MSEGWLWRRAWKHWIRRHRKPITVCATPPHLRLYANHHYSAIRVEWAKAHARVARFDEEVLLVQEEMRRVLEHHLWKGRWWRSQIGNRVEVNDAYRLGLQCYAEKQAKLWEKLATKCVRLWRPFLENKGMSIDAWPEICRDSL